MKFKTLILFVLSSVFFVGTNINAQVTIGSNIAPRSGSLLDLKDGTENESGANGATSKRGLLMPRVMLTDKNNLYPMFTSGSAEYTGANKTKEDLLHTGLWVFHVDKCTMEGKGLYVWNGSSWEKTGLTIMGGTILSQEYFDLPSGRDARALTSQNLEISWFGDTPPTWSQSAQSGYTAVSFNNVPLVPNPLVTTPTTMVLQPDAMTVAEAPAATPWRSKETVLTFNDGECGQTKTVILNQTNYALKANNSFTNSSLAIFTDAAEKSFFTQSNATWKATIQNDTKSIFQGISTTAGGTSAGNTTVSGGADDKTNTLPVAQNFYFKPNVGTGTKYGTATILFEDIQSPKRFFDITISANSCAGTPDISGLTSETAANSNRLDWVSAWGQNVISHDAKAGVYETFISADFGPAGRWMVTNHAAKAYDTGANNPFRTLQGPNANSSAITAYWTYPKAAAPVTVGEAASAEYTANPYLGFLYTWDAATAGKGGSGGTSGTNEAGSSTQTQIQGICPAGWHLPSEFEWAQLNSELSNNASKYSSSANGTPNNTVMKDVCELGSGGTSKSPTDGGFSVLMAGTAYGGNAVYYGVRTYFWTSSSSGNNTGNSWAFLSDGAVASTTTIRLSTGRLNLNCVRCKKN